MKPNKSLEKYELIPNKSLVYPNGSIWNTDKFGKLTIIGKTNIKIIEKDGSIKYRYYVCEFEDGTKSVASDRNIKGGKVKNPNYPNVVNIGFIGRGQFSRENNKKEYLLWKSILDRCYCEKRHKTHPTYKDVTVYKDWCNFQNFCEDIQHLKNYDKWINNLNIPNEFELDKDILCDKLNINPKIYSKDTCVFIIKKEHLIYSGVTGKTYIATRLSDNYQEEFMHQRNFSIKYKLDYRGINSCIKKRIKTHNGWKFEVKGE